MLVGTRLAVIPLGVSCQTAHQVEEHQGLLERLGGCALVRARTPFEWRIVGPSDTALMIRENNPYPTSAAELSGDRNRYWARRRCWFWHDKWDDFARFSSKQAHLWQNWSLIGGASRKVFVISDTQNNLKRVLAPHGCAPPVVDSTGMIDLARAIGEQFGTAELHLVTKATRERRGFLGERTTVDKRVTISRHWIAADRSSWQGDGTAWGHVFDRIITPRSTP